MSADYIEIADASSLLRFRKRHVYRIRWILLATNSHMLALILKYAIDARIGGWFRPTYLELNKTHLKNSRHQDGCIAISLSGLDMGNWEMGWSLSALYMSPPKVVHYASSLSIWVVTEWHRIVGVLKILAELERRIELGPWWVARVEVTWVQTEFVADSG
jgi:hypothetical protein